MLSLLKRTKISAHHPKKIGIYGGTFDPIHQGHIELALAARSSLQLDEVRILPCFEPAHGKIPLATAYDRLKMVELAFKNKNEFIIDDFEYKSGLPSRTINVLKDLRKRFPDASLCFIIGLDSLLHFTSWYQWQEIFKLAHIVVANRPGYVLPQEGKIADLLKEKYSKDKSTLHTSLAGSIVFFPAPELAVSSTAIRSKLIACENKTLPIPVGVHQYILKNRLYTTPETSPSHTRKAKL